MGRKKADASSPTIENDKFTPALTTERRMNQLASLALDQVEERMRTGKASAAEYVHFLKYTSLKEQKELEKLELEKQLLEAKTDSIKAQKNTAELYSRALKAMNLYSGNADEVDDDEEDLF